MGICMILKNQIGELCDCNDGSWDGFGSIVKVSEEEAVKLAKENWKRNTAKLLKEFVLQYDEKCCQNPYR